MNIIAAKILKKQVTSTFIAILFGFLVSCVILACASYNPFKVLSALGSGMFSTPKNIANIIIKSTPIILTGLSVAFAFKTGLFNIGAEGQYIAGSVMAAIVGIRLDLPPVVQVTLILTAGILGGALLGFAVGYLKAKFGIHEVITSIMLNWIALNLSNFLLNLTVFRKPNSSDSFSIKESGFTNVFYKWQTSKEGAKAIKENSFLKDIFKTNLNWGIIFAVLAVVVIWFLLYRTKKGYELRSVGLNADAAEFAGINVRRGIIQAMLISGALSGLAGALAVTGVSHHISMLNAFENNGFDGMSVALIAGSSPIGCLAAGLFLGGLNSGAPAIQSQVGTPLEIIKIMIGVIVFFVALTRLVPVIVRKFFKSKTNV